MILDAVQTQSAAYRCPVSSWGVMVTFLICVLLTASDEQGTLNPPADGLAGVTAAPEADDGDAAAACRQQFLIIVQSPGLSAVEAGRQYNQFAQRQACWRGRAAHIAAAAVGAPPVWAGEA